MAALDNARHEKFVQNLIEGMTQRQAYRDAFPKSAESTDKDVDDRASLLMKNTEVSRRLKELKEEISESIVQDKIMSEQEIQESLSKIARGEECEIVQNAKGEPITVQVKTGDRIKAMVELGKQKGMYETKVEIKTTKDQSEAIKELEELVYGQKASSGDDKE